MARMSKLISLIALLTLVIPLIFLSIPETASADFADIINGGFETGDFTGWDVTIPPGGAAQVVTNYASPFPPPNYRAREGRYFAWLKTDGPSSYTLVSQTFNAPKGSVLSGWAFFKAEDYMPWNDKSRVEITVNSAGGRILRTVFKASVSTVGDFGGTPWTYWSHVFASNGWYTIQARVKNASDSSMDSCMGLDGVSLFPPPLVPTQQVPTQQKRRSSPSTSGTPRSLNPSQMSLQYLSVNPQQTIANRPVTITTNVVNTGDEGGNYNVALKINGQLEKSMMVSVGPQGTQPVKFTITRAQPGTYTVVIGNQEGSFTILGADTSTSKPPVSGGLIAIFIMGILVFATVVALLATYRRPA